MNIITACFDLFNKNKNYKFKNYKFKYLEPKNILLNNPKIKCDLICIEKFDDNNIYYYHDLKILNELIGVDINLVKNYINIYPEIEFIFYNHIPEIINKDLFKIFIIHDNKKVVKIIGIN